jgi:plastocyanin
MESIRLMRVLMRARLVFGLALLAACGSDHVSLGPPVQTAKTVDIFTIGDAFSPTFATLAVGDTARWNFSGGSDGQGHNVRFTPAVTGQPADINVLKTGTATRVFTTKGTYNYVCDVHPGMNAQIVVQ